MLVDVDQRGCQCAFVVLEVCFVFGVLVAVC